MDSVDKITYFYRINTLIITIILIIGMCTKIFTNDYLGIYVGGGTAILLFITNLIILYKYSHSKIYTDDSNFDPIYLPRM